MTTTDGSSAARPLRKRKSKRFDRSGSSPRSSTATIDESKPKLGDDVVEVAEPDVVNVNIADATGDDAGDADVVDTDAVDADVDVADATGDDAVDADVVDSDDDVVDGDVVDTDAVGEKMPAAAVETMVVATDSSVAIRSRALEPRTACGRCGHEVSMINIEVDGHVLVMESCDNCDTRRWHLAGDEIELGQALDHVGEHAGRRR